MRAVDAATMLATRLRKAAGASVAQWGEAVAARQAAEEGAALAAVRAARAHLRNRLVALVVVGLLALLVLSIALRQ